MSDVGCLLPEFSKKLQTQLLRKSELPDLRVGIGVVEGVLGAPLGAHEVTLKNFSGLGLTRHYIAYIV